jgi:hypothetical protein
VDEGTGLLAKMSYAGPQGTIEETYSDFRDVSGIKIPFKISITQAGRKFAEAAILDYKVNTGVTVAEMSKRQ